MIQSRTSSVTKSVKASTHSLRGGLGFAVTAFPTLISTAGSLVSKIIGGRKLDNNQGLQSALAVAQAAIEGRSAFEIQYIYESTKHTKNSGWINNYAGKTNEQIARTAISSVNDFLRQAGQPTITYEKYVAEYRQSLLPQQPLPLTQYQQPLTQQQYLPQPPPQEQEQQAAITGGKMPSWLLPVVGGLGLVAFVLVGKNKK
jgi:hypothetical protein